MNMNNNFIVFIIIANLLSIILLSFSIYYLNKYFLTENNKVYSIIYEIQQTNKELQNKIKTDNYLFLENITNHIHQLEEYIHNLKREITDVKNNIKDQKVINIDTHRRIEHNQICLLRSLNEHIHNLIRENCDYICIGSYNMGDNTYRFNIPIIVHRNINDLNEINDYFKMTDHDNKIIKISLKQIKKLCNITNISISSPRSYIRVEIYCDNFCNQDSYICDMEHLRNNYLNAKDKVRTYINSINYNIIISYNNEILFE
jgi:hypothetical protein